MCHQTASLARCVICTRISVIIKTMHNCNPSRYLTPSDCPHVLIIPDTHAWTYTQMAIARCEVCALPRPPNESRIPAMNPVHHTLVADPATGGNAVVPAPYAEPGYYDSSLRFRGLSENFRHFAEGVQMLQGESRGCESERQTTRSHGRSRGRRSGSESRRGSGDAATAHDWLLGGTEAGRAPATTTAGPSSAPLPSVRFESSPGRSHARSARSKPLRAVVSADAALDKRKRSNASTENWGDDEYEDDEDEEDDVSHRKKAKSKAKSKGKDAERGTSKRRKLEDKKAKE